MFNEKEAQKHWDANSVLERKHREEETHKANLRWKAQNEKDDADCKAAVAWVKKFLRLN